MMDKTYDFTIEDVCECLEYWLDIVLTYKEEKQYKNFRVWCISAHNNVSILISECEFSEFGNVIECALWVLSYKKNYRKLVRMTLNEYQEKAGSTAQYGLDGQEYTVLGLVNEAGEVAGVVKKFIRGDYDNPDDEGQAYKTMREKLGYELSDMFWYLAMCAKEFNFTLEEIAQMNLDKLSDRLERNVIKGDGDER